MIQVHVTVSCKLHTESLLPPDDSLVEEVEQLVHMEKRTLPRRPTRKRGSAFLPKGAFEADVVSSTGRTLSIKGYSDSSGHVVELLDGSRVLRKLHTHPIHHNPGGALIQGGHKHFPTRNNPLVRKGSSYAYHVACEEFNLRELVGLFLDENYIENMGLAIPMDPPRRRRR